MASVFDTIKMKAGDTDRSNNWYRGQVNRIASGTTARELFRQGKLARRPSVGRLNLFGYNPKLRRTLPYYDVFPLVLPLEAIPGGFIGMNFHYLPPLLRTRLLERMQARATDKRFDSNTKFDVTYTDVKNLRIVKPTIKKYLYPYVQTGFLRINADEAATAIYLPVQRFKKASETRVYADSRRFI
jgi:hypothetical protein|tara:strand:- start:1150 stop:1704 length:555 start_codon:yes stop_codon:yes gene_type:complete